MTAEEFLIKKRKFIKEDFQICGVWIEIMEQYAKQEKKESYWEGFDFALKLLDEMYTSTHPHPYNIADCIKSKVNRLPNNKIRKTK